MSESEIGRALAIQALGRDTLSGSIGESLYAILGANSGRRLSEIGYPQDYLETATTHVSRDAARDTQVLGTRFAAGARVRVYFQPYVYNRDCAERDGIFGTGKHVCLGKKLSRALWQEIVGHLSGLDRAVTLIDYEQRPSDFVFAHPERLEVALA